VVPEFHAATACFLCSPPDFNSSRLSPFSVKATKQFSQIIQSTLIQKIKISQISSQANKSNHSNIFTFILPWSEGRADEVSEVYNKIMLSPPIPQQYNASLSSHYFSLSLLCILSHLSLLQSSAVLVKNDCVWWLVTFNKTKAI
jgi:hypothetical protein